MGTFTMPSLGADMEAGTLVEWLKTPGDQVERGDIIAVVETDKGAIEVEIFESGRIEQLLVEAGRKVPVGTPLALISGAQETAESAAPAAPVPPPPPPPATLHVEAPPVVPAAPGTRASPAARKAAQARQVDLRKVRGTGPGGAITLHDVQAFAPSEPEPKPHEAAPDLGPMRRAIAAAMSRSKREIPHFYLSHSMDVGAAQQAVMAHNAAHPPLERILLGAFLMKAVALALRDYPEFNGFYDNGVQPSAAIHLGLAISLRGGGLAAPAIHDADKLPVPVLMEKMRDLTNRVRSGRFRSSEMSDPTMTVTSLGDRGVEAVFPVIYPPQVAIIGLGAVIERPWSAEGRIETRPIMIATLAADHRASDGHRGALLLRRIDEFINQPEAL